MYRWEGWWKCLKMLWYFKIPKDYNTFIIFKTVKQIMTPKMLLTLKVMDFQNVALTKVAHIYMIEGMNA